jgi:hypothetical protein
MPKGPRNSQKMSVNQNYFQGGNSVSRKLAVANSFYTSTNLDFRTDPSQISVLPASRQMATNLTDLITAMDQDLNGVRYGVGNNGGLYRINTSNAVSSIGQLTSNGSAALYYNQTTDQLYIPGQQTVSMYGQCTMTNSGGPRLRLDQFAQSASQGAGTIFLFNNTDGLFDGFPRNNAQSFITGITEANVQQVTSTGTSTYILPTTIIENDLVNKCYFAPDIEPFYSIQIFIKTIGTGNWTLTLHDSLNNVLEAVTITNANLIANQFNEFKFATSGGITALVNASQTGNSPTYHFHLTSSVTNDTATVQTINTNDLSSVNFLLFAYRLVKTRNGWHPTTMFTGTGTQTLCIGNGPYLSTYNFGNDANPSNGQWSRHTLTFKVGEEVCGISTNNQYLVIACERRSSNANRNYQAGTLYFWSGTTNQPDFRIDVPMGAPYGLYTFNNVTYFACAGSLFAWSGGQTVIKVRKLAYQNTDYLGVVDSTIVNPNMFTSRYNLLMMGYPTSTTNTSLGYGIWSWGTVELTFPDSYGLSYTQSHGLLNYSSANQLQIGCCVNFVDSMYSSWSYIDSGGITRYGLDLVDNSSTAASIFNLTSLIYDGGVRYKTKNAYRFKLSFVALPTGCTLQPLISLDRGAFVSGPTAPAGATSLIYETNNSRFHEIQWGFQGTCPPGLTTPPTITGLTMEVDPLTEEVELRDDG